MRERIVWVDYVKVICIYLMIACHVDQKVFDAVWVYQFHMPAFFIVSGFLFKARPVIKNIKSFVTPVLLYSIINLGFNSLFLIHANGSLGGGQIKSLDGKFLDLQTGRTLPRHLVCCMPAGDASDVFFQLLQKAGVCHRSPVLPMDDGFTIFRERQQCITVPYLSCFRLCSILCCRALDQRTPRCISTGDKLQV